MNVKVEEKAKINIQLIFKALSTTTFFQKIPPVLFIT